MRTFATLIAGASAVHLTPDNFDELTAGKTVFLKMYAPWCGHCKSMAPAWEKLMGDFEDHENAFVAEVDCTAEGKPICDANGVQGFPTIKHGDPSSLEDYQGGRTYDDLKKFADENLKPKCSPLNIDLCDDDTKALIAEFQAMSLDEISAKIEEEEEKMEDADSLFKAEVQKLQAKYEKENKAKDEKIKAIKESGLGLMKAVRAAAAKNAEDDSDDKEEL